ncbi:MAG: glycosyltransferase family 2 protein [Bacteroidaceae bacterium]|nr:glycosyltransferase family 2 protein [Bacteroidaceae bacterium]
MKISVIIPLYNKETTITKTIESVLNQDFDSIEIIIVDDGSTDASVANVKKINSDKIKLFSKPNGGPSSAKNYGVKQSSGEWIMFLDADDMLVSGILRHFATLVQEHPDCNFFCGSFLVKYGDKLFPCSQKYTNGVLKNNFKAWCLGHFMPVAGSYIILRQKLLQYPFREDLRRYEDAESLFGIMRSTRIWTTTQAAMIYNQDSCCASRARTDISEDFIGHLSFEGKSLWEQFALWQLYRQGVKLYPNNMNRLYNFKGYEILKFSLLNLLSRTIYRWI